MGAAWGWGQRLSSVWGEIGLACLGTRITCRQGDTVLRRGSC